VRKTPRPAEERARYARGVLDLDENRIAAVPKDAATIVLVREAKDGVEIFCVERSKASRFMGGAIVFPGGKVDATDADLGWTSLVTEASSRSAPPFSSDASHQRAVSVAACRETLEEAAMLPVVGGGLSNDELLALRKDLASDPTALRTFLAGRGLKLDLAALHPFARWVTPEAEPRRFDTRFFLAIAPEGQSGAHDEHETVRSFWATPAEILRRFSAGEVQLMPPTHRTIMLLADAREAKHAIAFCEASSLEPICPKLAKHIDAKGETLALTLPGDRDHGVREARVAGPSRYVLRGEQWLAEDAPT